MNIYKEIECALKDAAFTGEVSKEHSEKAFTIHGWYKIAKDLYVYVQFSCTDGDDKLERWIEDGKPCKYYDSYQELINDHVENNKFIIRKLYREIYGRKLDNLDEDTYNYIEKKAFNMLISRKNIVNAIKEVFN